MLKNALLEVEAESETIRRLTRRVEAEYFEMPGLSVTMPQAQRLLGIEPETCAVVLKALIRRGVLRRTPRGTYIRASR